LEFGTETETVSQKYAPNPFEHIGAHLDLSTTHPGYDTRTIEAEPERKPKAARTSPVEELAYMLSDDFIDPLEKYEGATIRLYNKEDVFTAIEAGETKDPESQAKHLRIIKKLVSHGQFRKLVQIDDDFFFCLRALQDEYEQFAEVTKYIAGCAMVARHRQDRVLRMAPIILIGEPGTGKTEFSVQLSKVLRTRFKKIDMGAAQNNSDLAGSSSFYINSSPGKIFMLLTEGAPGDAVGNPLIVLDELDKASGTSKNDGSHLTAPLLTLLERHAAEQFVDLCVDIPVDVSNYLYIATCNDPEMVSRPLRSRFREFHITLDEDQKRRIAVRITNRLLDELPTVDIAFHPSAIDMLTALDSPRFVKQYAFEAVGNALMAQRDIVLPTDFKSSPSIRQKMGFI
jgi:Cdc6-like AAA superfamily ATPase